MKRHTLVAGTLNVSTVGLALVAWVGSVGSSVSALEIASLLGVTAFSLMWVHYIADLIAPRPEDAKDVQYVISRYAVLVAILAHPFLVNYYLVTNNFGFPPEGYLALLGDLAVVVLLGWIALAAFVLFELRSKLKRFDRQIFHANILAMFLVLIHGFLIGMVLMDTWYVWVWWMLLLAFVVAILVLYNQYYATNTSRKYVAYAMVLALALGGIAAGLTNVEAKYGNDQTQTASKIETSEDIEGIPAADSEVSTLPSTVTTDELKKEDGKDGNACWVAVDGVVYDTAGISEWQNGEHTTSNGMAKCGEDLSDVISQSPHGKEVLGKLAEIGTLAQ
jgi:predicted heme/steroid binding protein